MVENSAETAAVTEKVDQEVVKSSDATHSPEQAKTFEAAQDKAAETSENLKLQHKLQILKMLNLASTRCYGCNSRV